jgi:hypothetical protein
MRTCLRSTFRDSHETAAQTIQYGLKLSVKILSILILISVLGKGSMEIFIFGNRY